MIEKDLNALKWAMKVNNICLLNTVRFLSEYYSKNLIYNTLVLCGVKNIYANVLIKYI